MLSVLVSSPPAPARQAKAGGFLSLCALSTSTPYTREVDSWYAEGRYPFAPANPSQVLAGASFHSQYFP